MSQKFPYRYRIATSEANLAKGANFFIRGLPPPDQCFVNEWSAERPVDQGGVARLGYKSVILQWLILTSKQRKSIEDLIDTMESTAGVGQAQPYLTVPISDLHWIDIYGYVAMPKWTPVSGSNGAAFEDVRLVINNYTVVNDPSTVS